MTVTATTQVQQISEGWDICGEDDQVLIVAVKVSKKDFRRGQKVKVTVESAK